MTTNHGHSQLGNLTGMQLGRSQQLVTLSSEVFKHVGEFHLVTAALGLGACMRQLGRYQDSCYWAKVAISQTESLSTVDTFAAGEIQALICRTFGDLVPQTIWFRKTCECRAASGGHAVYLPLQFVGDIKRDCALYMERMEQRKPHAINSILQFIKL